MNYFPPGNISRLISRIYRKSQAFIDARLEHWGLGAGTYNMLLCVNRLSGCSQNELAAELALDKAWVARSVAFLESRGYVQVADNPRDRRSKSLFLTEEGQLLLPHIYEVITQWRALLTQDMDEAVVAQLEGYLDQLHLNATRGLEVLAQETGVDRG